MFVGPVVRTSTVSVCSVGSSRGGELASLGRSSQFPGGPQPRNNHSAQES